MDVGRIADKVNIPCGVFDENGKEVIASNKLKEILNNYGDFFSFLGIDRDNKVYNEGISVEKRVLFENEKKSFVFFIQKIGNFYVSYGIDITFNTRLIDSIIERSNVISQVLSTSTGGIYIKELEGDFVYSNPAFEELLDKIDYLDHYFLENLKHKNEIVNIRKIVFDNKERYIFEYGKVYEVAGKKQIRGFVLFDDMISDFFESLKGERDILFDILDYASVGVLYLTRDCLRLKFYNRFAVDTLKPERIERIKILGLFEPDVLFDANTVKLINETLSVKGKYHLYGYTIPNLDGEYDFSFLYGSNGIIVFFKKVLPDNEQKAYRRFRAMFEYASDAIFLMKNANKLENTHYNLGTGNDYSIKELAYIIAEIVGYKGKFNWDTSKPDGTMRKLLDSSKLISLGWKPKINLKNGIKETYRWYKEHLNGDL